MSSLFLSIFCTYALLSNDTALKRNRSFDLNFSSMSKAFCSPFENSNMLFKVATDIDTTNTPQRHISTPITLPKVLIGKKSPYPTVDIVMITHQMQFPILSKSYPDVEIKGLSNILIQYAPRIDGMTRAALRNICGDSFINALILYMKLA